MEEIQIHVLAFELLMELSFEMTLTKQGILFDMETFNETKIIFGNFNQLEIPISEGNNDKKTRPYISLDGDLKFKS